MRKGRRERGSEEVDGGRVYEYGEIIQNRERDVERREGRKGGMWGRIERKGESTGGKDGFRK